LEDFHFKATMATYQRLETTAFLVWGLLSIFQHAMGAFLPANGLSSRKLLNSKGGRQPGCFRFQSPPSGCRLPAISLTKLQMSQEDESSSDDESEQPLIETTVRIDDGGSNLTNRFKYKMHALMGTFDPKTGEDDERQGGNILDGTFATIYVTVFH
jgi:hypothetical protein